MARSKTKCKVIKNLGKYEIMNSVGKPLGNITEKVWYSLDKQVWDVMGNLVTIQQFEQLKHKLRNQVRDQVSVQAWQEVKQNVKLCGI
jgi:hypothetical protein